MDCEHPAHTEEIKAKTVLPTSAEEVQSISTHQLYVLTARGVASFSKVRGMDVICLLTIETMDTMTEVYNMYQKYFNNPRGKLFLLQTTNIQTKYIKNLPVLSLKLMPPATSSPKVVIMGSGKGIGPNSYSCGTSKPQ